MSDNVVSLKGGAVTSQSKTEFLAALGQSFDRYVAANNCEPEAFIYGLCGVGLCSRIGWHTAGNSRGSALSLIALTAAHLLAEVRPTPIEDER